jgi:hypothetical protein
MSVVQRPLPGHEWHNHDAFVVFGFKALLPSEGREVSRCVDLDFRPREIECVTLSEHVALTGLAVGDGKKSVQALVVPAVIELQLLHGQVLALPVALRHRTIRMKVFNYGTVTGLAHLRLWGNLREGRT